MSMDKGLARALGQLRRRSNEAKWLAASHYQCDPGMWTSWEHDVARSMRTARQLGATPEQIGRAGAFYPRRRILPAPRGIGRERWTLVHREYRWMWQCTT